MGITDRTYTVRNWFQSLTEIAFKRVNVLWRYHVEGHMSVNGTNFVYMLVNAAKAGPYK